MEYKKPKWEMEFERLSNTNIDEEIANLERKGTNKEEYKINQETLKKLKIFKDNKPKIVRLLAFRNKQKLKLIKLKKEQQNYQIELNLLKTLNEEAQVIDLEHQKLMEERANIVNELKNAKTEEYKTTLETKRDKINEKLNENGEKFVKNQARLQSKLSANLKPVDNTKQIQNISETISKCNMICKSLLNGKSWDDIELKLGEWQKTKYKGEMKEQIKNARDNRTINEQLTKQTNSNEQSKKEEVEVNNEQAITVKKKFDWRHPVKSIKQFIEQRKQEKEKVEQEEIEVNNTKRRAPFEANFYQKIADGNFERNDKANETARNAKDPYRTYNDGRG